MGDPSETTRRHRVSWVARCARPWLIRYESNRETCSRELRGRNGSGVQCANAAGCGGLALVWSSELGFSCWVVKSAGV